jgi:hypothetical protein
MTELLSGHNQHCTIKDCELACKGDLDLYATDLGLVRHTSSYCI